jgi:K+-sensing histidine kinase KdpD
MPEPTTTEPKWPTDFTWPADPKWPELFSVMVHDVRTPMTVINGYIDMLLKERFGPLNEKSCAKVHVLLQGGSELTSIERGTRAFNPKAADLHEILRTAIEQLPPPEREVRVELETSRGDVALQADVPHLTKAFASVITGVRREVVLSDVVTIREEHDASEFRVRIGDADTLALFDGVAVADLPVFDEWRGGIGMTLAVARRILNAHQGRILAPPEGRRAGALILLPRRRREPDRHRHARTPRTPAPA